jgi:hypothetical protein
MRWRKATRTSSPAPARAASCLDPVVFGQYRKPPPRFAESLSSSAVVTRWFCEGTVVRPHDLVTWRGSEWQCFVCGRQGRPFCLLRMSERDVWS